MDKKTIEKEVNDLVKTLEKQIDNLKEKTSDVIEDERVQKVLNTITDKTVDFLGEVKDKVSGVGCVVCKTYQEGLERIKKTGVHIECLAYVKSMNNNTIEFEKP